MADACPNCGVWLGNEPLPNDSAWERLQAEVERLQAEVFAEAYKAELRALEIERLQVERDALRFDNAELLDGLESKYDYAQRMDARAEALLARVAGLCAAGDKVADVFASLHGDQAWVHDLLDAWLEVRHEQ